MSHRKLTERRRPSGPILLLLGLAIVTTFATSPSDNPPYLMGWSSNFGTQAKIEVKIAKRMLDYLHDKAPDSPWYVDIYLNDIDPIQGETIRWWLLDEEGQSATTEPVEFTVGSGVAPALQFRSHLAFNGLEDTDGVSHAVAQLGRLCYRQSAAEDCLPCDLKRGCTFQMALDACGAGTVEEAVFVIRQGEAGFITCQNEPQPFISCGGDGERPCATLAILGETNVTPYTLPEDTPACRVVEAPAPVDGGVIIDAEGPAEDATPGVDVAVEPPLDAEVEPEADAGMEPEADAAMEPEADAAMEPEADAAMELEADAAMEPEADAAMEPEADAAMEPEADAAMEPEADAAMEPEADAAMEPDAD